MSQNSRNKSLLLSTPYVLQRQLFDFLCLETRLNLRKCSKRCQSLVDYMPLTLDFLAIKASTFVVIKYSETKTGTNDKYIKSYIVNFSSEKEEDATNAATEIGVIFSNPNLKIGYLNLIVADEVRTIHYRENLGSILAGFLKRLKFMIFFLPHKINVQHFFLSDNLLTPEDYCAFLSCLKTEKLESISLAGERIGDSFHKIVRLQQIKRVPSIDIIDTADRVPFDILSNTSSFLIRVEHFLESDFNRILEDYLQRVNFLMARVFVNKSEMEPWITEFLTRNQAVEIEHGIMIAVLEGPKFKNTVEVGEFLIAFRRTI